MYIYIYPIYRTKKIEATRAFSEALHVNCEVLLDSPELVQRLRDLAQQRQKAWVDVRELDLS